MYNISWCSFFLFAFGHAGAVFSHQRLLTFATLPFLEVILLSYLPGNNGKMQCNERQIMHWNCLCIWCSNCCGKVHWLGFFLALFYDSCTDSHNFIVFRHWTYRKTEQVIIMNRIFSCTLSIKKIDVMYFSHSGHVERFLFINSNL